MPIPFWIVMLLAPWNGPAVSHTAAPTHQTAVDSLRTVIGKAAGDYFTVWLNLWKASEKIRVRRDDPGFDSLSFDVAAGSANPEAFSGDNRKRLMFIHCHPIRDGLEADQQAAGVRPAYKAITSLNTSFAVCPSWTLDSNAAKLDENRDADVGIAPQFRPQVTKARAQLLAVLDRAASVLPGDGIINGQRVRFLVEQKSFAKAHEISRACGVEAWWCAALDGYVSEREEQLPAAEASFARARAAMPDAVRCNWDDIRPFLPVPRRVLYSDASCSEREAINARFWWLSDPMYIEPGNERRTNHDARRMHVLLNAAFDTDGRFRWNDKLGGDAMAKLVVRYGWPSYIAWGSAMVDGSHTGWLSTHSSPGRPPYTTFEYSPNRVHTIPRWRAVQNPFTATDSMWDLNGNWNAKFPTPVWWPIEHMQRARRLLPLAEGQTAMLRRQNEIVLASATNLDLDMFVQFGASTVGALVTTTGPDQFTVVDQTQAKYGTTMLLQGRIPSGSSIMALEIRDPQLNGLDLRRRQGMSTPPTLAEMKQGQFALSDPLLVSAPANANELSVLGDAVVDRMLGTTTLSKRNPRVGIYWESYGFRPEDSVTVTVRLERHAEVGALSRVGIALNIKDDPNSTVEIAWREPDLAHTARTLVGPVPVQMRSIVLNIAQLEPGPYDVVVRVGNNGATPATGRRRVTIVP